jgi:tRNA pseudouridine synthase 10
MLGKGRPFIAELVLPRKRVTDLARVESEINSMFKGKIFVSGLSMCQLCDVSELKDAHHGKVYSALVGTDNEFDVNKVPLDEELSIIQTTPTRVARRRANMDRDKKVTILRVVKITPREYVVDLLTSHGTYVKEFISGDNKRTKPSLSSITGVNCTCVLLDVLEICTD